MSKQRILTSLLTACCVLGLSACTSYVKRADYDAAISELRSRDNDLQSRIEANRAAIDQLRTTMETRLAQHEARITELAGRLHVDMNVHFAYDKAELRDVDKVTLNDFAKVIREHHANAHVTVEGFTDPAGDAGYNKALGQRRADAVRDYLVSSGGLNGANIQSVSYGETRERQLQPGAWGDQGLSNRRVSLVVDLPPVAG